MCGLLPLLFAFAAVVWAAPTPPPPNKCQVTGYVFKAGVRPEGAAVEYLNVNRRVQSALKGSINETAAACNTDARCIMFTTDGWLLGVRALQLNDKDKPSLDAVSSDTSMLTWMKPDCGPCNFRTGCCGSVNQNTTCCGTFIAEDLGTNSTYTTSLDANKVQLDVDTQFAVGPLSLNGSTPCGASQYFEYDCNQTVLGAPLREVYESGLHQFVPVEQRCKESLQDVRRSSPGCCEKCFTACCQAISNHVQKYTNFTLKSSGCNYTDPAIAQHGGVSCSYEPPTCCTNATKELAYVRQHMPLFDYTLFDYNCSRECIRLCGFKVVTGYVDNVCDLGCVLDVIDRRGYVMSQYCEPKRVCQPQPPDAAAHAGKVGFPAYMYQLYVLKSKRQSGPVTLRPQAAANGKRCTLC